MKKHFLFIAAENDGIPECKAGGMADVVRDVPRQIAAFGDQVSVVTPSHGRLHHKAQLRHKWSVIYRGQEEQVALYEVQGKRPDPQIRHYVIHHESFRPGDIAHIYFNDPEKPFYTDTLNFSLFGVALARGVIKGVFGEVDQAHLHDWHSSFFLFLREYHPEYRELRKIRCVYSIHNLAIQGIRPLDNDHGSMKAFFPELESLPERIKDPRYTDCFNLMAMGIRLADAVHTVSPSYMEDIQKPSIPPEFIGGEGLEADLKDAAKEGRLYGILNGCNYANINKAAPGKIYHNALKATLQWLQMADKKYKAHFLAHTGEKLAGLLEQPPAMVCCSVARLTEQKFYFFKQDPGLFEQMLEILKDRKGVFILLGTGAPEYERLFRAMSRRHKNFIFINGQSEEVIDSLYAESDLYIMPSLFEPCGISQMLAMRNGQPCLVHHTGGLIDTVEHGKTGFSFSGKTLEEKKMDFVKVFREATSLFFESPETWVEICERAAARRFTWEDSVRAYYRDLYEISLTEKA